MPARTVPQPEDNVVRISPHPHPLPDIAGNGKTWRPCATPGERGERIAALRAVAGAQNNASRFVADGQCLTQQLERAKRESETRLEWAKRSAARIHQLELKVRRLQRELKR